MASPLIFNQDPICSNRSWKTGMRVPSAVGPTYVQQGVTNWVAKMTDLRFLTFTQRFPPQLEKTRSDERHKKNLVCNSSCGPSDKRIATAASFVRANQQHWQVSAHQYFQQYFMIGSISRISCSIGENRKWYFFHHSKTNTTISKDELHRPSSCKWK